MILYIDTSSLVKLYFSEEKTEEIQKMILPQEGAFSSIITYPEMLSALSRKRREGFLNESTYKRTIHKFQNDWERYSQIPFTAELSILAGSLCKKYPLRGMDAIHIASASWLKNELGEDIHFLSSDKNQLHAASKEDLVI